VAASTFTIVSSALCFDYFNIPPVFAFALPDAHSVLTLGGMLSTAVIVCSLLQLLRHQRGAARESEARTLELCSLSLDLSEVSRSEELPRVGERHLARLFGAEARIVMRDAAGEAAVSGLSPSERAGVERSLRAHSPSFELVSAEGRAFQRIVSGSATLGVIVVPVLPGVVELPRDRSLLLAACADRVAVAIDRLALATAARRAQVAVEAERLRNELLSAMSHDLKTPLAAILTASTLLLRPDFASEGVRRELTKTIVDETERLNGLVTNLLSVTRLESGKVELHRTPEALDELVFAVLARLSDRLEGRAVEVDAAGVLPLVSMDPVLVDQVLVNLIENVLRYTPAGSPLTIRVRRREREVAVEVADRGPGIDGEEQEKVFEKFYRGRHARKKDGGSGLGLTICRAVARAHGGRIAIRSRMGGGASVEFALPAGADDDSNARASQSSLEAHA
jgi:two-component system sensor histidine kinase KdpD